MANFLDGLLSGKNAFTQTTASLTQPAVGSNVTVPVVFSGWAAVGLAVFLEVGGSYQVVSIPNDSSLVLKNLGTVGNASPDASVPPGRLSPAGLPSAGGGGAAAPVPIVTVITSNVASLAAAPSSNDGYTLLNTDVVALANQTTTSNNRLYTSNGAGLLTPLATQPADGTLLSVTKGVNLINALWRYSANAVTATGSNAGTIVGPNGTVVPYAPDIAGGTNKLIANEGIAVAAIPNDAAFHTVWSFNFVGRGYTTGAITILALVMAIDGSKTIRVRLECVVFCSATPTITAVTAADILDDAGGSGGYVTVRYLVSGSTINLQIKNLQGAAVKYTGIVGLITVAP